MTILGDPNEAAIPVGYLTFEMPTIPAPIIRVAPPTRVPAMELKPKEEKVEEVPPVAAEAVDWTKYIPWVLLGIALLAK